MAQRKDSLDTYLAFARSHFPPKDPAHDFCHIERICGRLQWLSEGVDPPPRPHMLYFIAAFHGSQRQIDEVKELRSDMRGFLRELGWGDDEIDDALVSLRRHLVDPHTSEEKIVHDANYVELVGAFGIAKAFTVGGARGQSYEETVTIFETHYLDKVAFRTPAGQRIAQEKRAYTKDFLTRLRSEWQESLGH